MRRLWDSFCTAFSMYTILPVPPAKWDREAMRYALCYFPLVGIAILLPAFLWQYLAFRWRMAAGLFAAVATLLPLLLSGGIHMDGWLDTVDALSSHAAPQRKLEILSDPHIGAFGVLGCAGYLLLSFGLWCQVYQTPRLLAFPCIGYVLSRSLNGLGIACFPCAKTSGLVYLFAGGASPRASILCCGLGAGVSVLFFILLEPLWGGIVSGACLLCFVAQRRLCLREFGGNTGDLSGFLTQNIELFTLLAAAVGGMLG